MPKKNKSKYRSYTVAEFRETFKVGDYVQARLGSRVLRITAIGESKFLAISHAGAAEAAHMIETYMDRESYRGFAKVDQSQVLHR